MTNRLIFILLLFLTVRSFSQGIQPPYYNDFDSPGDTLNWYHYALNGTDDWELGEPDDTYFSSAFSYPYAWTTNLDGPVAQGSEMVLETPYFDLTGIDTNYILSFVNSRHNSYQHEYYVEYTLDSINWFIYDSPNTLQLYWQDPISGFPGGTELNQRVSIKLTPLIGEDSVKFRFRHVSPPSTWYEGWMIDDFKIVPVVVDIYGIATDTLFGYNKYVPDFTINLQFGFYNEWYTSKLIHCDVYFSEDTIIDGGDTFLGQEWRNAHSTITFWNHTYTMPSNLAAGTYYILSDIDVRDSVIEASEINNVSKTVLFIDSIYNPPFIDDFENPSLNWDREDGSLWYKGTPEFFGIEGARSGSNSWYTFRDQVGGGGLLTSPFLDLSSSSNTSLCYWFSSSTSNEIQGYSASRIRIPEFQIHMNLPYFTVPSYRENRNPRRYGWDCHCIDLSSHDGEQTFKVAFYNYPSSPFAHEELSDQLDDVYIGPKKPDASIERDNLRRFTRSDYNSDTLFYTFFNSGLSPLATSETEFYWSNDSLLDPGDLLLGTKTESALLDTSFIDTYFVYNKQNTSTSVFYIISKSDAQNSISEMREYDNITYFKIHQAQTSNLPYLNDFESQIDNWNHMASIGLDFAKWDIPSGIGLDSIFAGQKSIILDPSIDSLGITRTHVFSPIFDLTELNHPIIEFDISLPRDEVPIQGVFHNSMLGTLKYSVNGGQTWEIFETNNDNKRRFYGNVNYNSTNGMDIYAGPNTPISSQYNTVYSYGSPGFVPDLSYQGRYYDDNYHCSADLIDLANHKSIQFCFVFAKRDTLSLGVTLDNFSISEAESNLTCNTNKNLMLSSDDHVVYDNILIKNNSNSKSDSTGVRIYLSQNNQLEAATDQLIWEEKLPSILPYQNHPIGFVDTVSYSLQNFNYLIVDIDPDNLQIESNEQDNHHLIQLNMDTVQHITSEYFNDFSSNEIDGWKWRSDSLGIDIQLGEKLGYSFRHKKVIYDPAVNVNDDGEFFLDYIYRVSFHDWWYYPTYYLETPSFNLTQLTNPFIEFDMLSRTVNSSNEEGANLDFSVDGGETWQVLGSIYDTTEINWYNQYSISSLDGQSGWASGGNWIYVKRHLNEVNNESNVKFRFKFRGIHQGGFHFSHGFRLDNFKIVGNFSDTLNPIILCEGDSTIIFGQMRTYPGIYVDSLIAVSGNDSLIVQELRYDYFVPNINDDGIHIFTDTIGDNYQWVTCPDYTPITGAQSNQFSPSDTAYYAVIVTRNGCPDTSFCRNIWNLSTTSLLNNSLVEIYPNPTSGRINIVLPDQNEKHRIRITNQLGQIVYSMDDIKERQFVIDIPGLPGIYILEIWKGDQIIGRERIVKN